MAALLNSKQAARLLGVKVTTLHAWVSRGEGPRIAERTVSGCYRISKDDIELFRTTRVIAALNRGIHVCRGGAQT
jgi:predicted site-specific integrase-resolvase